MQKYLSSKNILLLLFLQFVFITLIAIGVLPRYYAFFIALAAAVYILFAEQIDSLCFCVASIPLYIALPITKSFDTMIYWRILFIELLAILIIKNRKIIGREIKKIISFDSWKSRVEFIWEKYKIEILALAIFILASLSLIGAPDPAAGIKRIVYYANIFIFYLAVKYIVKSADDLKRVLKHLGLAAGIFLAAGFLQLFMLYFIPYQNFWQFWASKVSLAFYGQQLSQFVSFNNSWFAFGANGTNIRMFSLFWCSLAFAMSMMMFSVVPLSFLFENSGEIEKKKKIALWIFIGFLMMAIILSGSRGAWLSIAFPLAMVLILASFKKTSREEKKLYIKKIIIMFLVFGALFPFSPIILKSKDVSTSSIGRIWTVKDIGEVSNKTRLDIWKTSLKSVKENPILGTGLANFSAEYEKLGEKWKTTSHNIFLYAATEIGIPAAILMIILSIIFIKDAVCEFYSADDKFLKMFFLSTAVVSIWVLGYSLIIDSLLTADKTTLIFVTLAGLFYATRRIQKQKRDALGIGDTPGV